MGQILHAGQASRDAKPVKVLSNKNVHFQNLIRQYLSFRHQSVGSLELLRLPLIISGILWSVDKRILGLRYELSYFSKYIEVLMEILH